MNQDKNSMLFWYPKIAKLADQVPQPKTQILEVDSNLCWSCLDGKPDFQKRYGEKIEEIVNNFGYPFFLRTDYCSGKWDWEESCFVPSLKKLLLHIFRVIEATALADKETNALVFREYIPMESKFRAFWGKLPISVERRYFIDCGKVLCHHPYWPEDAITQVEWTLEEKIKKTWKNLLVEMNQETKEEILTLTKYCELVGKEMGGFWSVDFAKSEKGIWYLIDMALGKNSWHPACSKRKKVEIL